MERRWSSRVWAIQGIALARSHKTLLGEEFFNIDDLYQISIGVSIWDFTKWLFLEDRVGQVGHSGDTMRRIILIRRVLLNKLELYMYDYQSYAVRAAETFMKATQYIIPSHPGLESSLSIKDPGSHLKTPLLAFLASFLTSATGLV